MKTSRDAGLRTDRESAGTPLSSPSILPPPGAPRLSSQPHENKQVTQKMTPELRLYSRNYMACLAGILAPLEKQRTYVPPDRSNRRPLAGLPPVAAPPLGAAGLTFNFRERRQRNSGQAKRNCLKAPPPAYSGNIRTENDSQRTGGPPCR